MNKEQQVETLDRLKEKYPFLDWKIEPYDFGNKTAIALEYKYRAATPLKNEKESVLQLVWMLKSRLEEIISVLEGGDTNGKEEN